ncbi:zinc finger C2HC domain-containing protein 1C isoform X2 [Agrilus planipennis]|uniref:Zinc finger C2HC domain-containing protein 1C isoform X2 n=1 Tax=Agrilus planipennis TaxID=224129 RepID=A0A1W4WK77_AGRPL|nr:zinc finger C2HC domain-containing protein 1C isoform X2 [Agrilus planipennis]
MKKNNNKAFKVLDEVTFKKANAPWVKNASDDFPEKSKARFQEKQMQQKEEKLLRLLENQQQRTMERINRGSPVNTTNESHKTSYMVSHNSSTATKGKVRQMFDERRQKAGIDRNHPLEPLKTSKSTSLNGFVKSPVRNDSKMERNNNSGVLRTTIRTTVQNKIFKSRNGKPVVNEKKVFRSLYTNNNGKEAIQEECYVENNNSIDKSLASRMNSIQIGDGLENQELPNVRLDLYDDKGDIYSKGNEMNHFEKNGIAIHKPDPVAPKKESKPIVRTTQTRIQKSPGGSSFNQNPTTLRSLSGTTTPVKQLSSHSNSNRNLTSNTLTSPTVSPSGSNKTSATSMSQPKSANNNKAPSTARPSAKPRQPPSAVVRDDLEQCKYCGRRFVVDRLQLHEEICARAGKKQRKTYDSTKHRVQGTELEQFVRKKKPGKGANKILPEANWRKRHEEFIATIRAAKVTQAHLAKGGKLSDLPPPPPSYNPDYVQCPHCGRRFNQAAAERHIPKCATYEFNKPKPKAPSKSSASTKSGGSY